VTHARHSISSLAVAGLVAVVLSAAPVGLGSDYAPEIKSAFAKGGGGGAGGGGGNAGGNGGGHGGSNGVGHSSHGNGNGFGHDKGPGNDHDVDAASNNHGEKASALGNLNAAHASPTAMANASSNSTVGLIAAYAQAVKAGQITTTAEAQQALGAISNKSSQDEELGVDAVDAVDAAVVAAVNELLGIENFDAEAEEDAGEEK